jgi:hypothetical protein
MTGHDYRASREHWDRVFAEPWAQEYLARCREPSPEKTPSETEASTVEQPADAAQTGERA